MVIMIFYEQTELFWKYKNKDNSNVMSERERERERERRRYKFQFWQNSWAIFVDILHKSQSMFIPFSFCQYEECLF